MRSLLGDKDYDTFQKIGFVDIPSHKKKGTGYRIRKEGRIGLLRKGIFSGTLLEVKESLCIDVRASYEYVPGDRVATKILMCKFNEDLLWNKANLMSFGA